MYEVCHNLAHCCGTIYLDDDVMIVGSMGNFVTYDLASRTKTCCTVHTKIDAHKKKTTKKQQKNRKRKVGMQKKKKKTKNTYLRWI